MHPVNTWTVSKCRYFITGVFGPGFEVSKLLLMDCGRSVTYRPSARMMYVFVAPAPSRNNIML